MLICYDIEFPSIAEAVLVSGTVGQNVLISPRDMLFPEAPSEGTVGTPGVVLGKFDLKRLKESRSKTDFFPARDQTGRKIEIEKRE